MMANYTKGPWFVGNFGVVFSRRGVVTQTPEYSFEEAMENARLISAAPDLLEALDEIVYGVKPHEEQMEMAKAAIKKATGQ